MGRGVGGKDRQSHADFSPRYGERERRSGWGVAPLSRKLWVGNLGPRMTENVLSEQFLRFGDIESISYIPGRSFAYVNFKKEEDAHLALRGLHGSSVAGMPLRIEFAKGRRASMLPQDDEYRQHKNARRSIERGEPPQRRGDLRSQHYSPEKSSDKAKGNKSSDPSEVLWIGFPSFLNVDETMLRRAFSPFGEIEKITSFPGRSYAFVRYRSVVAACRAKEALQGKLFNNPRVNICFARSDMPTEHGKAMENGPFSQHVKHKFFHGSTEQDFEQLHGDEGFESPLRDFQRVSPPFRPSLDRARSDAHHAVDFARNNSSRFGSGSYENVRLREFVPERRSDDIFERRRASPEERSPPWHSNIPYERRQRVPPFVDSSAAEERSFPLAKKHKVDLMPDKDLPEYPFSDLEQDMRESQRKPFHDYPDHHAYNQPLDSAPFGLKEAHDFSRNRPRQPEIDDSWGNAGRLSTTSRPLLNNSSPKLLRPIPEPHKPPPLDEMWKWEGTIAKGGTQVCRARCFPVGKVLDFMLPEFLNCTARTGLDMLAKHYYQAVGTWVVFFVPESDADIAFYNEFMHYLGEKQRAAVAKLGEKVTLFLVPPSDFSEQVLKVPGKVSISGVILKFQQNASNFISLHHPINSTEPKAPALVVHDGASFLKPNSPDFRPFYHKQNQVGSSSGYLNPGTFPPPSKPSERPPYTIPSHGGKPRDVYIDETGDQLQLHNPPLQPDWSSNKPISNSSIGTYNPAPMSPFGRTFSKDFPSISGYMHETFAPTPAIKFPPPPEIKPQATSATSTTLQPEQLAQLAAILGSQKQSGEEDDRGKFSNLSQNPSSQSLASTMYNSSSLPSASVEHPSGQMQQGQAQGPQPHDASPVQKMGQQTDQQEQKNSREDAEADPEKRLQATLQLAAALLQQIQQRSKPVE